MEANDANAVQTPAFVQTPTVMASQPQLPRSKRKKRPNSAAADGTVAASAASSSAPHPKRAHTAASHSAARSSTGAGTGASASGAGAVPSALAPFVAHRTLGGFYASGTVSSCPCGLRLQGGARALVVGDGDLSYSVGLVRHLCSPQHARYEAADDAAIAAAAQGGPAWSFDNCITDAAARTFYGSNDSNNKDDGDDGHRSGVAGVPLDGSSFVRSPSSLRLTCTTFEEAPALHQRYAQSAANAALLAAWGIKVLHGIDARALHTYGHILEPNNAGVVAATAPHDASASSSSSSMADAASALAATGASASSPPAPCTFHHVLFHFPHIGGKSRIHLNRALVGDFLASAARILVPRERSPGGAQGGCIHLSLLRGQGGSPGDPARRPQYGDSWQVLEGGSRAGLGLAHLQPLQPTLYPPYNNKGFRSRDQEFSDRRGAGVTHRLVRIEPAVVTLESQQAPPLTHADLAAIEAREADCIEIDCSQPSCKRPLDPATLIPEVREALSMHQRSRGLCDVPGHPLQRVRACLERSFRHRDTAASSSTNNDEEAPLRALGLERCAFRPPSVPVSSIRVRRRCDVAESFVAGASSPEVPSSSGSSPQSPSSSLLSSSSWMDCSLVVVDDSSATIESLHWNLEPLLAVANDMEGQMELPIAARIRTASAAASTATTMKPSSTATPAATSAAPLSASTAAASSSPSAATAAPLEAVPFMSGGMSLLHQLLAVQMFRRGANFATIPTAEPLRVAMMDHFASAARAAIGALFGASAAVLVRPNPVSSPVSSPTGTAPSSSSTSSLLPPPLSLPLPCTHCPQDMEVLLQHTDGVWHVVARGGLLLSSSPTTATATATVGWALQLCLDKLAMLRFGIADPRWLWSRDERVAQQWVSTSSAASTSPPSASESSSTSDLSAWPQFVPFTLHPLAYIRDNSFWLNPVRVTAASAPPPPPAAATAAAAPIVEAAAAASSSSAATTRPLLDGATFMRVYTESVRRLVGSGLCCSVRVTDQFVHPSRGAAMRFRLVYHSVDRALAPDDVAALQERLHAHVVATTGVEMR